MEPQSKRLDDQCTINIYCNTISIQGWRMDAALESVPPLKVFSGIQECRLLELHGKDTSMYTLSFGKLRHVQFRAHMVD